MESRNSDGISDENPSKFLTGRISVGNSDSDVDSDVNSVGQSLMTPSGALYVAFSVGVRPHLCSGEVQLGFMFLPVQRICAMFHCFSPF